MSISIEDLNKVRKQRNYRPYSNQIFYDNLNGNYVITKDCFLLTEQKTEALTYRSFNNGIDIVISLTKFNAVLDNGLLRFVQVTNPSVILEQRDMLGDAIALLKECKDGVIASESYNKIETFLNSINL